MNDNIKIEAAKVSNIINMYSEIHKIFDNFQYESELLRKGEDKINVISEFYALMYAKSLYGSENVDINRKMERKGVDIAVFDNDDSLMKKIQVNTISYFAETRKSSRIRPSNNNTAVDYVYFISLNENLQVDGFWILSSKKIIKSLAKKRITYPDLKKENKLGSKIFQKNCKKIEFNINEYIS